MQAVICDIFVLMVLKEVDGIGGLGNKNLGFIYCVKKVDVDKVEVELQVIKMWVLFFIVEQELAVMELDSLMKVDIVGLEWGVYGGMVVCMEVLYWLGLESNVIYWVSIFIMLFFIVVEIVFIFVKFILLCSFYDYLLYNYEYEFEMDNFEKVSFWNNIIKNKVRFDIEISLYWIQQEIKIEKELINIYLCCKKEVIEQIFVEWECLLFFWEVSQ